jgi:hypothetical protein
MGPYHGGNGQGWDLGEGWDGGGVGTATFGRRIGGSDGFWFHHREHRGHRAGGLKRVAKESFFVPGSVNCECSVVKASGDRTARKTSMLRDGAVRRISMLRRACAGGGAGP